MNQISIDQIQSATSYQDLRRAVFEALPKAKAEPVVDSPEVAELKAKLKKLEAHQDLMKRANPIIKKYYKLDVRDASSLNYPAYAKAIHQLNQDRGEEPFAQKTLELMLKPDFANRIGFPAFELTSVNDKIKRIKANLAKLEAQQPKVEPDPEPEPVIEPKPDPYAMKLPKIKKGQKFLLNGEEYTFLRFNQARMNQKGGRPVVAVKTGSTEFSNLSLIAFRDAKPIEEEPEPTVEPEAVTGNSLSVEVALDDPQYGRWNATAKALSLMANELKEQIAKKGSIVYRPAQISEATEEDLLKIISVQSIYSDTEKYADKPEGFTAGIFIRHEPENGQRFHPADFCWYSEKFGDNVRISSNIGQFKKGIPVDPDEGYKYLSAITSAVKMEPEPTVEPEDEGEEETSIAQYTADLFNSFEVILMTDGIGTSEDAALFYCPIKVDGVKTIDVPAGMQKKINKGVRVATVYHVKTGTNDTLAHLTLLKERGAKLLLTGVQPREAANFAADMASRYPRLQSEIHRAKNDGDLTEIFRTVELLGKMQNSEMRTLDLAAELGVPIYIREDYSRNLSLFIQE
jgi:hypothetical protein